MSTENKKPLRSFTRDQFRVETMRGEGKGGQKRNKTDSCVRITHIESGISAYNCDTKSQHQNKKRCFEVLVQRLLEHYFPVAQFEKRENATFGSEIRSYKEPIQLVKDETGVEGQFSTIVHGDGLDAILKSRLRAIRKEK